MSERETHTDARHPLSESNLLVCSVGNKVDVPNRVPMPLVCTVCFFALFFFYLPSISIRAILGANCVYENVYDLVPIVAFVCWAWDAVDSEMCDSFPSK